MKYRSRTDIIGTILRSANKGATKTRLMYGSYLSYAQTKEYIDFLLTKELLRYEPKTQLYTLTDKGLNFLRIYDEIGELMSIPHNEEEMDVKGIS